MSDIYIVIALNEGEIENCEAFSAVQVALGRAFQLASDKAKSHKDWVDLSPKEEVLSDGSTVRTFMDTSKQKVVMYKRNIGDALLSPKDPMNFSHPLSGVTGSLDQQIVSQGPTGPTGPTGQVGVATKPYDFKDVELPVGWFEKGKPAQMKDMLADPFGIKDPLWLSENEKWALVEARIRKSPDYRSPEIDANGTKIHYVWAVDEVKSRSDSGTKIRDAEIQALHDLREDLMIGID